MNNIYDLIIIGTGPAGYTASIYASRYKLKHILIGKLSGGLATEASKICNFPSETTISGLDLMEKFKKNVKFQGGNIIIDEVLETVKEKDLFKVTTRSKNEYFSKTILLAIGTERRKLNIKDEEKFIGKGITYCTTCDGPLYKGKTIAVVGGCDAANTASLYLSKIASKVYQIYRKDNLRGDLECIEQIKSNNKIEVICNKTIKELKGKERLESIVLDDRKEIKIDGLFIEIGSVPNTIFINKLGIKTNADGFIIVDQAQKTNVNGVWAAGDITTNSNGFRQIITACAEGAVAAENIFKSLIKS
jgi:thioredoxin reductase (NADPH)